MKELKIETKINEDVYSQYQLDYIQYEREKHVLQEMIYLGAAVTHDNKELSFDDINYLSMEEAKTISLKARAELGPEGTRKLYANELERSEKLWKTIAASFDESNPTFKKASTYMKVSGLSFDEMMAATLHAMEGVDTSGLSANPEHFALGEEDTGAQNIKSGMETMGMYGGPIDLRVVMDPNMKTPAVEEEGFKTMVSGTSMLPDGTIRHDIAVHQVKTLEDGFELNLAVYFPEATPTELVNGHSIHLAIEFSEGIKAAYKGKLMMMEAE